jgi:hypothetical protein
VTRLPAAASGLSDRVRDRVECFLDDFNGTILARKVLGVVVCGSAARGEEVWDGDRLLSDIDIMLLTRRTDPRLMAAAGPILARHRSDGIDGGPMPLGPLRTHATMLIYETRATGVVVAGDVDLKALAGPFEAAQIPAWEGFRVLANRMLEHVKAIDGRVPAERAVAKGYEALAEASLVAEGRYLPTYRTRMDELERRPPAGVDPAVVARMTGVLHQRLDGGPAVDVRPATARGDLVDGLARLGTLVTGEPGDAATQLGVLARSSVNWKHRAWWTAVMLSRRRLRSIPLRTDPSIAIWRRALEVVTDPARLASDPALLGDWHDCPQIIQKRRSPAP